MTRQATKKKRDRNRAEKKKHEHRTEQMAEKAAKKKRGHTEEVIAIIVLLIFVPFMVIGIVWWPAGKGESEGTGLQNGTYTASYIESQPASADHTAVAALDVNGESILVNESDLSGNAVDNSTAFFEGQRGQQVEITVKNGIVTRWKQVP